MEAANLGAEVRGGQILTYPRQACTRHFVPKKYAAKMTNTKPIRFQFRGSE